ncbi:hypothetical protein Prudu_009738, partial [Prunus dulcis]
MRVCVGSLANDHHVPVSVVPSHKIQCPSLPQTALIKIPNDRAELSPRLFNGLDYHVKSWVGILHNMEIRRNKKPKISKLQSQSNFIIFSFLLLFNFHIDNFFLCFWCLCLCQFDNSLPVFAVLRSMFIIVKISTSRWRISNKTRILDNKHQKSIAEQEHVVLIKAVAEQFHRSCRCEGIEGMKKERNQGRRLSEAGLLFCNMPKEMKLE